MKEESKPPHAKSVYGAPAQKNPHPLKFTKDAAPGDCDGQEKKSYLKFGSCELFSM